MVNGFMIVWDTRKVSKRTGKSVRHSFESESYSEVDAKWHEMKEKGYKVSRIMQVIL